MAPVGGRLALGKVGITGIRKPLTILRPERMLPLTATFQVFVDLPASRKGSDLSRNAQILAEIVDETAMRPSPSLEDICVTIARELLVRHTYASEAEVSVEAEYFLSRGIRPERKSLENFLLMASAWARRDNGDVKVRKAIGAEAVGMTACPCAMETCREALRQEFTDLASSPSLESMPIITHNQRNRTRLTLVLPERLEVEADQILDVIEASQSSPTYAILKRGDEGQLVLNAHRNPKFVEDVIRSVLYLTGRKFAHLPDDVEVRAETQSEESIHKYDVRAEHTATLGELKRLSPN